MSSKFSVKPDGPPCNFHPEQIAIQNVNNNNNSNNNNNNDNSKNDNNYNANADENDNMNTNTVAGRNMADATWRQGLLKTVLGAALRDAAGYVSQ